MTALQSDTYPGYSIDEQGRIFSDRAGRFLKPIRMGEYLGVQIPDRTGRLQKRYVHRLVLEFTTGACPAGMQARHLDGDRFNNAPANLAWGTPTENNGDKKRHGTTGAGERNAMARLTWSQVVAIRERAAAGCKQIALAREFDVSAMTISRVVRRETWTAA